MQCVRYAAACIILMWSAGSAHAQDRSVRRADVIAAAIARGPRVSLARSDANAARAQVTLARQWENPVLAYEHTMDTPREHLSISVPLTIPRQRTTGINVARATLRAASQRLAFETEAVAYEADTTYTMAIVATARAQLSARAARDADSLVALAILRRDAGDASELEVELARVNAGEIRNASDVAALEAFDGILAIQALMGLPTDGLLLSFADTLEVDVNDVATPTGTSLLIAAAQFDAEAAELALSLERRRLFSAPSLSLGVDTRDPGGFGNQLLPAIGVALVVPLFNRNHAASQAAGAARDRANANVQLARIELGVARSRAARVLAVSRERLDRSQRLAASAQRVTALSLLAYQEGVAALSLVLDAQRTSREMLFQVLDDRASVRNSSGLLRLLSLPATLPVE